MEGLKVQNSSARQNSPLPWFAEPNLGGYVSAELKEFVTEEFERATHWGHGFHPSGGLVKKFETDFSEMFSFKHSLAVSNNGVGFSMLLESLDLGLDCEAIIPALNFKAWHMALVEKKIRLKLCDIDFGTLNMSVETVEPLINEHTRLICLTHYSGLPCDITKILEMVSFYENKFGHKIWVIEDCARSVGQKFDGQAVGLHTDAAVFSFHSAKLMTTLGEGGMIVTRHQNLHEKLRDIRSYGGETIWGLNYKLSEIQGLAGSVQLRSFAKEMQSRVEAGKIWIEDSKKYESFFRIPEKFIGDDNIFYFFPIVLQPKFSGKENLVKEVLSQNYGLICSEPKVVCDRWEFLANIDPNASLKTSRDAAGRVILIPFHYRFTREERIYVYESVSAACSSLLL